MKNALIIILTTLVAAGNAQNSKINNSTMETATLGGGCFWCTEAVFEEIEGVESVISGYSGGDVVNPSYREVTSGRTGHAEVIQFDFNPDIISFEEILEVFFKTHDPTTLNRQGADVGPQYRSVIYYHNEEQRKTAVNVIEKLNNSGEFENKIVTELTPFANFYIAEDYHQDYFRKNPNQAYCSYVIRPKVDKLKKNFAGKLKR